MLRFPWRLAGLLVCLLVLAGCNGSHPLPGTVEGYVYQPVATSGEMLISRAAAPPAGYQPLPGAVVTVSGTSLAASSDQQGKFQLTGVPAGSRLLSVSAPGYRTVTVSVQVYSGRTSTVGEQLLQGCARRWTVLVYMNGDNDLEQYAPADLNEMEQVGGSGEVEVLVQLDRRPGYDDSNGDWTGARRLRVVQDGGHPTITSPVLQDLGEVDMGSPAVLQRFVQWGCALLPAEHYALIIWGHGNGWLPSRMGALPADSRAQAISFDDTSGSSLTPQELAAALAPTPVELLVLDACLMGTVEVAYELRGGARFLVTSQGSPLATGYPYGTFLQRLEAAPTMGGAEVGALLADLLVQAQGMQADAAVSDLTQVGGLATALDGLAGALLSSPTAGPAYAMACEATPEVVLAGQRDLWALVSALPTGTWSAAAGQVRLAMGEVVICRRGNSALHGLTIYAPPRGSYLSSYSDLALAQDTRWDQWLGAP